MITKWTSWQSLTNTVGTPRTDSLRALFNAPAAYTSELTFPGYSCATFRPCTRKKANVRHVTALVFDVDGGAPSALEDAQRALVGRSGFIATTKSDSSDARSFRAVLFLSREATPAEFDRLWLLGAKVLGDHAVKVDKACKDPSRFWFMPSTGCVVTDLEGAPIDVDAACVPAPPPGVPARRREAYVTAAMQLECRKVREAAEGTRNAALNTAALKLGHYVGGGVLEESDAEAALEAAARAVGLGEEERVKTIRSGLTAGKREPRTVPERPLPATSSAARAPATRDAVNDNVPAVTGQCTEAGNAERLVDVFGYVLRYVSTWEEWIGYDGRRWERGAGIEVRYAIESARRFLAEALAEQQVAARDYLTAVAAGGEVDASLAAKKRAADAKVQWATKSQNASVIRGTLTLAASHRALRITHADLDADPWLFNCLNGTIDLRTGSLRPHDSRDLVTKLAPVAFIPNAPAPIFDRFLSEAMGGNFELAAYLQRFAGYALTGVIREHTLTFNHGDGSNGKGTFWEHALVPVWGDYARKAPRGLLFAARNEQHPCDLAELHGARLVLCSEVEEGKVWDEAKVKDLTGGDKINARRMRENFWQFSPTHKLTIAGNHKPVVRGTDNGIWRRMRLVPWNVVVTKENIDTELPAKLRAEMEGILAWCVRGCLAWQRDGLGEPAEVREATDAYREESDPMGEFLAAHTRFEADAKVPRKLLRKSYEDWCAENGVKHILDAKRFSSDLRRRGASETTMRIPSSTSPVDAWRGLRMANDEERGNE
jgi:putative DNA primase/helicase